MDYLIQPSALTSGTVTVPGDKSISHRALLLGAIADGSTEIRGFLAGEDCLATLAALQKLGVEVRCGAAVTDCDADGVAIDTERIRAGTVLWAAVERAWARSGPAS